MKFSKIICKIVYRCRSIPGCITRTSRVEFSPPPSIVPVIPEIDITPVQAYATDEARCSTRLSAFGPSLLSDRSAGSSRKDSNTPTTRPASTVPFYPLSVSLAEIWNDILPNHALPRSPMHTAVQSISAEEIPKITIPIPEVINLQRENAELQIAFKRQQDEIHRLTTHVEASQITIFQLEHAKSSKPRLMKKQIASLSHQLQLSQAEVTDWRTKCAKIAWTAGLKEEIGQTRAILEESVSELEGQAAEWRTRLERVGRLARQVERKGKGLGMWWNREFEYLGEIWDRGLHFDDP